MSSIDTTVCIVGGGPAGVMAGALLSRQGVDVVVIEKHSDFLRDFRGDTIHPSTLEVLNRLGWLTEFLELPHRKMSRVEVQLGQKSVVVADFSHLPVVCPYIAFVPQHHFLDFVVQRAESSTFRLMRPAEGVHLVRESGRIVGVRTRTGDGEIEIRAALTIGADGRSSMTRMDAGLPGRSDSPPLDVLWFHLERRPGETQPLFRGGRGALICIDRGDYWQLAYVIPHGASDDLREGGIEPLRQRIASMVPAFADRLAGIGAWEDVHTLEVTVNRLTRWHRPGLLCIGDAAHAMSPAGGVGINLAIQDAVATGNILGPRLLRGCCSDDDLAAVQRRRALPARATQMFQTAVLRDLYPTSLSDDTTQHPPAALRLIGQVPGLARATGRFIGMGLRPELPAPVPPEGSRALPEGGSDLRQQG